LFTGDILIKNGVIKSNRNVSGQGFDWKFDSARVRFSRLKFLFKNKISFGVSFFNVKANTYIKENKITFLDHLQDIFEPNDTMPVKIKAVSINNLELNLAYFQDDKEAKNLFLNLHGSLSLEKLKSLNKKQEKWQAVLALQDGALLFENKKILNKLSGKSYFHLDFGSIDNCIFKINKEFKFLDTKFLLSGMWHKAKKKIVLKDKNDLINIQLGRPEGANNKNKIGAKFCLKNLASDYLNKDLEFRGSGFYDLIDKTGNICIYNQSQISLKKSLDYFIAPKKFNINLNFNNNLNFTGDYNLSINENNSKNKYNFNGSCFINKDNIKLSGKVFTGSYLLESDFYPNFYIKKLLYIQGAQKLIDLKTSNNSLHLDGSIKYCFINSLLPSEVKRSLFGKNTILSLSLDQSDLSLLRGSLVSSGGSFYIPGNYNPIKKLGLSFEFNNLLSKLTLYELYLDFFKGRLSCPQASFHFDKDYNLSFAHVPLQIDDWLINYEKDFYGFIYGNLLLSKIPNSNSKVEADLILKKTLLKEGLFAENKNNSIGLLALDSSIASEDNGIEFDINLTNQEPVRINSSILQADANIDLSLRALYLANRFQTPQIVGDIQVENGSLNFLHHNLYINYGKIQFIPNQMDDPIIDLVAKNRVKKYLVSLHATGSLQAPNIILESFPELTEEEILALLIAGSEDASFQANLPAIFLQNLNHLIVKGNNILPKTNAFFAKLTMPFKYVQITPNFTDQLGGGGIKGTLSIDLNKQINAQIQKNFNLQEDFAFHVEYFLTDDVNFKVVRDQSGELGSQVEVRLRL